MGRKRFGDQTCGIARSLDIFGDWWSLLIIRDAFFGIRRFKDFQQHLGISKNILTQRLRRLVDNEILERVDVGQQGERFEYHLTEKGDALLPILTTLREWGDAWVFGTGNEPLTMHERKTGKRIPKTIVRDAAGAPVNRKSVRARPGPGADESIHRIFDRRPNTEE